jgi:hypothetical protein
MSKCLSPSLGLLLIVIVALQSCASYTVYPRDNLVKLKCAQSSSTLEDCKLMTNVLICDDKNLYCEYISLPIHD